MHVREKLVLMVMLFVAHQLQIAQMSRERIVERRELVVGETILLALGLDDRRHLRVVNLRDVREQMMRDLVVQMASQKRSKR